MSSSSFITIYPTHDGRDFHTLLAKTKSIFKHVWEKKYSGFTEKGYIKGTDFEESEFDPFGTIGKTLSTDKYWFGFFNGCYKDSWIDKKKGIHQATIYQVIAEIFCSLSEYYIISTSTSFENEKFQLVFYDRKKFTFKERLSLEKYYQALATREENEKNLENAKKCVLDAEKIIEEQESVIEEKEIKE